MSDVSPEPLVCIVQPLGGEQSHAPVDEQKAVEHAPGEETSDKQDDTRRKLLD